MALGDGGFSTNQDNNKKDYSPVVYSPVTFRNPEATTDPSELGFAFWKNLLKITISPKLDQKDDDKFASYDHKNNAAIYINHMKARMLKAEIEDMITNPGTLNSVGVNSGATGLITFSDGKEFGLDTYVLVIRKMDENGNVSSSYSYQFNGNKYYNSIRNFDEAKLSFDKKYFELLEIEAFLDLLEDYSRSQNYAMAYTVVDSMKYDVSRNNTKIELIMDKLGIERKTNSGNGYSGGGKSFFDASRNAAKESEYSNAGYSKSSKTTTLDDLSSELE